MNTEDKAVAAGNAVIAAIVVSAILGWATRYGVGGPFTPTLDLLGVVTAIIFDPSVEVLLLAAGIVLMWLGDDGF
ncbi:hypothetical protein [Halorubrum ezzemoulense]|uniref:hypothetical protein n=1 Tax=Halorubrum ezzemoulense TaxID=337243 RepID=UPI000A1EC074|nr:hypothetical protein [Halorubrum ezzemoulense]